MKLAIISGHSSGLGLALWKIAEAEGCARLGLSRRAFGQYDPNTRFCSIDLSSAEAWESKIEQVMSGWSLTPSEIFLFNNAGTIDPVCPLRDLSIEELQASMQLNVVAPMRLMRWVWQQFPTLPIRIVNISSGAAWKPYRSWSVYCSSKAALRMSTQVAALEAEHQGRDIRLISYAPGVLDTPMQEHLRTLDKEVFPDVERFENLYTFKQLTSPTDSAHYVWSLILNSSLPSFSEHRFEHPKP